MKLRSLSVGSLLCVSLSTTMGCRHTTSTVKAEAAPDCSVYPLVVKTPEDSSRTAAEKKFNEMKKTWGSEATMTWAGPLGTPQNINNVEIPISGCSADESEKIFPALIAELEKYPEIFHIKGKEWISTSSDFTCSTFATDKTSILSLKRDRYAGEKIDGDELKVSVRRSGKKLVISSILGWYLPEANPLIVGQMASCETYKPEVVKSQLAQMHLPYEIYNNCISEGQGAYTYAPNDDSLTFSETPFWTVFRETDRVTLFKTVYGTLEIQGLHSKKTFTPEIMASDAFCSPDPKTPPFAGFSLVIDGKTGQIYQPRPGIRDCITCFQGK